MYNQLKNLIKLTGDTQVPARLLFAKVTQTDPLTVFVDNRFSLSGLPLICLQAPEWVDGDGHSQQARAPEVGDTVVLLRNLGGQEYLVLQTLSTEKTSAGNAPLESLSLGEIGSVDIEGSKYVNLHEVVASLKAKGVDATYIGADEDGNSNFRISYNAVHLFISSGPVFLSASSSDGKINDKNLLGRYNYIEESRIGKYLDALTKAAAQKEKDSLFASNSYLTASQMEVNASYIYKYLKKENWTDEAIAAMFGNMQVESNFNPGLWQTRNEGNMNGGFGLVQWSPATKLFDWADTNNLDPYDIDTQLNRLLLEAKGDIDEWQSWRTNENENFKELFGTNYRMTFSEFTQSTKSLEELAAVFMLNYERPGDKSKEKQAERGSNARKWYNYFKKVEV
jgi:hypothetical protein